MPSPLSENHSRPPTSLQHRNQLLWTGAVAILLGLAALQQASSPVSSMTGLPALDAPLSPLSLGQVNEPADLSSRLRRSPSGEDVATHE